MDPKKSVIKARNTAVRNAGDQPDKMSDYDRKNMEGYGFIYADGTYSDEREPRGATLVPRRPNPGSMWDPDRREWYDGGGSADGDDASKPGRSKLAAPAFGGNSQEEATAPSVPTLSSEPGEPSEEAWLRARLKQIEAAKSTTNIPLESPLAPKTDVYPTHSVAHSVKGVTSSGDPAASPMRPESLEFGKTYVGPAPTQEQVEASNAALALESRQRTITTSGGNLTPETQGHTAVDLRGVGQVPQQGASLVGRPVADTTQPVRGENLKGAAPAPTQQPGKVEPLMSGEQAVQQTHAGGATQQKPDAAKAAGAPNAPKLKV